jgi:hypothetical protein
LIAAYNDMAKVRDPAGGVALLIGLEAFIPLQAPLAAGHNVLSVGYGRLEAGAAGTWCAARTGITTLMLAAIAAI